MVSVGSGTITDIAKDATFRAGIPFVVAINMFYGRLKHNLDDVRWALAANNDTPLITFDARSRPSVRDALLTDCRHALQRATAGV